MTTRLHRRGPPVAGSSHDGVASAGTSERRSTRSCRCAAPEDRRCRRCRGARPFPAQAAPNSSSPPRRSRAPARHRSRPSDGARSFRPGVRSRDRNPPLRAPPRADAAPPPFAHGDGADHGAENEPGGGSLFVGVRRPGKPRAANQAAIDADRIRPVEDDRLLRRRMRGQRVAKRGQARHRGRAARCAAALRAPARRRIRRDRSGRHGPACRRPRRRRSLSHAQRRRRPRAAHQPKGGGRSSAGANGACSGLPVSSGIWAPGLVLPICYNYNLRCVAASPAVSGHGATNRDNMADRPQTIILCSCEDTMPLDAGAVQARLPRREGRDRASTLPRRARAIPRRGRRRRAADGRLHAGSAAVLRSGAGGRRPISPSSISARPPAGRATAAEAGPKMAALLAAAAEPAPDVPFVTLASEGVVLIYGRDERAIEAGEPAQGPSRRHGADHSRPLRWRRRASPIFRWSRARSAPPRAISARSRLWSTIMPQPAPSSRGALAFGPARDGAVSRCDIMLDISGGAPLFTAPDLRDGYLRADPGDPAAVLRAVLKARDLVGTFDKPRYIAFTADLCAHSRSQHRRLPPLPRPLPDRRDRARRRSRRDRRQHLRRLRPMRRGLPDRRRRLCVAARRCADAQAAHAARGLSRGRRRARRSCCCTTTTHGGR